MHPRSIMVPICVELIDGMAATTFLISFPELEEVRACRRGMELWTDKDSCLDCHCGSFPRVRWENNCVHALN